MLHKSTTTSTPRKFPRGARTHKFVAPPKKRRRKLSKAQEIFCAIIEAPKARVNTTLFDEEIRSRLAKGIRHQALKGLNIYYQAVGYSQFKASFNKFEQVELKTTQLSTAARNFLAPAWTEGPYVPSEVVTQDVRGLVLQAHGHLGEWASLEKVHKLGFGCCIRRKSGDKEKAQAVQLLAVKFMKLFRKAFGNEKCPYYVHEIVMHLPSMIEECPVDIMEVSGQSLEHLNKWRKMQGGMTSRRYFTDTDVTKKGKRRRGIMDQLADMDIVGRHFAESYKQRPSYYHRKVMKVGRQDTPLQVKKQPVGEVD